MAWFGAESWHSVSRRWPVVRWLPMMAAHVDFEEKSARARTTLDALVADAESVGRFGLAWRESSCGMVYSITTGLAY